MNEVGHFPWPQATVDVAFARCMCVAGTDELFVANFCRLKQLDKDQFLRTECQRDEFARFVFDVIYARLPVETINQLRDDFSGDE